MGNQARFGERTEAAQFYSDGMGEKEMRKIIIEVVTTIAVWAAWIGVMAGVIWFGVYMVQGLMGALQ